MNQNFKLRTVMIQVFAPLFLVSATFAQVEGITIEGDANSSPVYVLDGNAETTFLVDGDINVDGSFNFSMDDAASPNVTAFGYYHVTSWNWDAELEASSVYTIKSYRNLISVSFIHLCNRKVDGDFLIEGIHCDSGQILSEGSMVLVTPNPRRLVNPNSYFLSGKMRGYVFGQLGGFLVKNCRYRKVPFTQTIDVANEDWGVWKGDWDFSTDGNNQISGDGDLIIGPVSDPVEIVPQTVNGAVDKKGNYLWTAAGSGPDAGVKVKVKLKITGDQASFPDRKNFVSAAGQTRKF